MLRNPVCGVFIVVGCLTPKFKKRDNWIHVSGSDTFIWPTSPLRQSQNHSAALNQGFSLIAATTTAHRSQISCSWFTNPRSVTTTNKHVWCAAGSSAGTFYTTWTKCPKDRLQLCSICNYYSSLSSLWFDHNSDLNASFYVVFVFKWLWMLCQWSCLLPQL